MITSPFGFQYSGDPGAVLSPFPGVRFSPQTGRVERQRWEGTPEDIAALEAGLQAAGISYSIAPGQTGGFRTIDIDEPTAETSSGQLFQTDDLLGSDPEKDIFLHSDLLAADAVSREVLRRQTQSYDDGKRDYAPVLAALAAEETTAGLASGLLSSRFDEHVQGVRSFFESNWIIRRTTVLAPGCPLQTVANVGCVFETSTDLETAEVIDPNRVWEIPAGQWLKKTPQFQRQRNGTTVFSVEWWWALQWSITQYPRATL